VINKYLLFLGVTLFSLLGIDTHAQVISDQAEVTILNCDDGSEIYSMFGHTAVRVVDPSTGVDKVFNYGIFEYADDFSYKFAKGKVKYMLGVESMNNFLWQYNASKRSVREQVLDLSPVQVKAVYEALMTNAMPESKYYKYDFFFDNCATRINEILRGALGDSWEVYQHPDANKYSYRDLINVNLERSPWFEVGINLALGSRIDVKVNNQNLMFLPVYIEEIFEKSKVDGHPMVRVNRVVFEFPPHSTEASFIGSASFYGWLIFVMAVILVFIPWARVAHIFDGLFFTSMGLVGALVVFLWFMTDHGATKANYNLLWANPIHIVVPYMMIKKAWRFKLHKFFFVMAWFNLFLLVSWIFLPQEFPAAVKPLILVLGLRYLYWYRITRPVVSEA